MRYSRLQNLENIGFTSVKPMVSQSDKDSPETQFWLRFKRLWEWFWLHFGNITRISNSTVPLCATLRLYSAISHQWPPTGLLKIRVGGTGACLWCLGKTSLSRITMLKPSVKQWFGDMAKTHAIRKGGLLRGKVPQGETSPLKALR